MFGKFASTQLKRDWVALKIVSRKGTLKVWDTDSSVFAVALKEVVTFPKRIGMPLRPGGIVFVLQDLEQVTKWTSQRFKRQGMSMRVVSTAAGFDSEALFCQKHMSTYHHSINIDTQMITKKQIVGHKGGDGKTLGGLVAMAIAAKTFDVRGQADATFQLQQIRLHLTAEGWRKRKVEWGFFQQITRQERNET
ncbi:hypothetical protein B0H13DRAFT_1917684 [Mycena leptocephala]|nr:hypothetical protein B0H13DRAFT_1917684 [Mycena leptocephala]